MTDMMSTLKMLLGDNADAKIQNAINVLGNSGILNQIQQSTDNNAAQNSTVQTEKNAVSADIKSENITSAENSSATQNNAHSQSSSGGNAYLTPEGMQFVGQIRNMVEQMSNTNDSRSNLLRSLRPFMRTDRQRSIDRAIRLINIGRFSGLFGR